MTLVEILLLLAAFAIAGMVLGRFLKAAALVAVSVLVVLAAMIFGIVARWSLPGTVSLCLALPAALQLGYLAGLWLASSRRDRLAKARPIVRTSVPPGSSSEGS